MEKSNHINHIMRNGLIDIQWKAHNIARQADDILKRCKEMEAALDKVDKDEETGKERRIP